jgi:hypothetical protein
MADVKKHTATYYDKLVMSTLPEFVALCTEAHNERRDMVIIHPATFQDEPELMYAAVQYASKRNINVTFVQDALIHPDNHTIVSKK